MLVRLPPAAPGLIVREIRPISAFAGYEVPLS
jgi:hypothetical protein